MKLCQCKSQHYLTIQKILNQSYENRLDSFGIYPGNDIENTGLFMKEVQIVISLDRILAVPFMISKDIII